MAAFVYACSSALNLNICAVSVYLVFAGLGAPDLWKCVDKVSTPTPRMVVPTDAKMALLLAVPDMATRWVVIIAAEAGLRMSQTVALRLVDFSGGFVSSTGKRGNPTLIPVSAGINRMLMCLHPGADETVPIIQHFDNGRRFRRPQSIIGKRLRAWQLSQGITRLLTLHDLRRGLAHKVFMATKDVAMVKSLLSHSSLRSTFWYLHGGNATLTADTLNLAIERKKA